METNPWEKRGLQSSIELTKLDLEPWTQGVPEQDETKVFLSLLNAVQACGCGFSKSIFLLSLKHSLNKWPLFLQYVQLGIDPTLEDHSERSDLGPDVEPLLSGDLELDVLEYLDSETFFLSESEPFNELIL
jgi:hypothetical protein